MNNGSTKWTLSSPVSMLTVQHTIVLKEIHLLHADFQADFQGQDRDVEACEGKLELLQIFYKNGDVSLNADILNFKMEQNTYRFQYFKQCSQNNRGIC